ncbi:hypothetical protein M899_1006 [Bacteriovorax sp. BSW11_IV]|uniref:hypothetical protein n=1 Tax=Bacteriovorax sp. BSW11_IV TaxID=1353529 RepID=UPI000389F86E|nr:hypothetical protein [Bacteriovorax sp. BSW11_IV]EQC48671.1 hypothetical protein M899_1006 [Bacteriovorax sp. BSW11_IV]
MKRISLTFLCFSIIAITFANDFMESTLTLRTSLSKHKTYKIAKITKEVLPNDEGNAIIIHTKGDEKCVIPLQKVVDVPRPKYQGCTHCNEKNEEIENYYSEIFLNGQTPEISCDISEGKVMAFSFIGRTSVKGKPMLVNQGLVFDNAVYEDKAFKPVVKEPTAIDRFFDDAAKVLLKYAY